MSMKGKPLADVRVTLCQRAFMCVRKKNAGQKRTAEMTLSTKCGHIRSSQMA